MPPSIKKISIFDFKVSEHEIDLGKSVPKLQGSSNWRAWEKQMLRMLGFNNKVYVQLINDEMWMPSPPTYEDASHASVKALLLKEAEGNKEMECRITEEVIEARCAEIVASNLELQKRYADGEEKWERANKRALQQFVSTLGPEAYALVSGHSNVHDAYTKLAEEYWDETHYGSYSRFYKLLNLQYKKGDPHTFVARFKKLLGDYTEVVGKMTPMQEFCHFQWATICNDLCYTKYFIDLDIDDEEPDLDQIYSDFIKIMREN